MQAKRIAFLTNLIPPYHKPLFTLLSKHYSEFRLFISTPMEYNRPWKPDWSGLAVTVQKGITLQVRWHHDRGFKEAVALHLPTDTLWHLADFHPDAVISVEMGFRTLLACLYAAFHPRCRLLVWSEVTADTEQRRSGTRHLLRRLIARRAHGFLAVGSGGVRYIESLGVARARIFQIAYSTNLAPFIDIPLARESALARRLLFSGQLIERKGLVQFLAALARWAEAHSDSNIEFSIVGDGPLRAALAAIFLPRNVKLLFIGTVQYDQLPGVYAQAGILVLPTLADTWAVVVNEALASGLPVLGSIYSQAVNEMVEDGKNGWTFRPENQEEMYNALSRALATSDFDLNAMRCHARMRALEVTPENAAAVCIEALGG